MLLMIEKGLRGGISMISNRHGKDNNPYMGSDYDEKKPTKYSTYLDANNLYGCAMIQPLPICKLEWLENFFLWWMENFENWRDKACILEVDLKYPDHLHDLHNDYPLAPERVMVNRVRKLIPNLNNKEKYVVHHKNLKLYESIGLRMAKIHRNITFVEKPWLKS